MTRSAIENMRSQASATARTSNVSTVTKQVTTAKTRVAQSETSTALGRTAEGKKPKNSGMYNNWAPEEELNVQTKTPLPKTPPIQMVISMNQFQPALDP